MSKNLLNSSLAATRLAGKLPVRTGTPASSPAAPLSPTVAAALGIEEEPVITAINSPEPAGKPNAIGEENPQDTAQRLKQLPEEVPFNTLLKTETYLRLRQYLHWEPGAKIKKATEQAICAFLDQFESSNKPLPVDILDEVLNQGKIKGYKKRS
ncbi:hypothetical protein [Hymenobacter sp. GOD-10R]|uniref:hypothetical protein n=1 Tax=Hymenobacter sp. GOD-10R TaxID=3093922 RepID=UPI002D7811AA|nr:hypothetical protein [Hymenobacter sp. GOD-10R]WRQ31902.1 hypothetical protein SD425_29145 [Hymenobacter sp. GOD-10R]